MTKRINIKPILIALVIFEILFLYSIDAKAHCVEALHASVKGGTEHHEHQ